MNYKNKKRMQILAYIASKVEENVFTEKLAKLAFLSDKLFLLKYGKTITGDRYVALTRGSVGSQTLALIDRNEKFVDDDRGAIKEVNHTFEIINKKNKIVKLKNNNCELGAVSEAEREVIDYIIENFGKKEYEDISDYTHKLKEWGVFECTEASCANIEIQDMFRIDFNDVNDPLVKILSRDIVTGAKAIYDGII